MGLPNLTNVHVEYCSSTTERARSSEVICEYDKSSCLAHTSESETCMRPRTMSESMGRKTRAEASPTSVWLLQNIRRGEGHTNNRPSFEGFWVEGVAGRLGRA